MLNKLISLINNCHPLILLGVLAIVFKAPFAVWAFSSLLAMLIVIADKLDKISKSMKTENQNDEQTFIEETK